MPAPYSIGAKLSTTGGTGGVLYTDRRDFYLKPNMTIELEPSETPFITFLQKLEMVKTHDPDYKMFEHRQAWLNIGWVLNNATPGVTMVVNTETIAIAIDGMAGGAVVGQIVDIYDTTGATFKGTGVVTTVTSQTSIKITPVYVASGALADNDRFFVTGLASEEHSGSPIGWADELQTAWNSAGIMKTPLEISGTLHAMTKLRGYSRELARIRGEKAKEHKVRREENLLFSRRVGGVSAAPDHIVGPDGKVIRTTQGIVPIIEGYNGGANVHNVVGDSYTYNDLITDMKLIFKYVNTKGVKYIFGGDDLTGFWSTLTGTGSDSLLGVGQVRVGPSENKFGFDVDVLKTPFGILKVARAPIMTRTHDGLYSGYGVIVDPKNVKHVTYRPSKYEAGIQANDLDGVKDQFFSDEGLWAGLPETHHMMKWTAS